MNQEELFHEDIYNALWHVVQATGGSKRVASELRPDITIERGARWLANCLDRSRDEKLDPEQFLWLLKRGCQHGVHAAMYFSCDETSYERPQTTTPEDEKARLQRDYIEAARAVVAIGKRLEKVA